MEKVSMFVRLLTMEILLLSFWTAVQSYEFKPLPSEQQQRLVLKLYMTKFVKPGLLEDKTTDLVTSKIPNDAETDERSYKLQITGISSLLWKNALQFGVIYTVAHGTFDTNYVYATVNIVFAMSDLSTTFTTSNVSGLYVSAYDAENALRLCNDAWIYPTGDIIKEASDAYWKFLAEYIIWYIDFEVSAVPTIEFTQDAAEREHLTTVIQKFCQKVVTNFFVDYPKKVLESIIKIFTDRLNPLQP